jgi:predicted NBD/HSP70 family sugar kinase
VNIATARVVRPPIMPGWHDYPIREHLADHFPAPVFVDNDANLMALGEWRLLYPQLGSLLMVKVATGIGAGLVLNGEVYRGIDGGSGDIGHAKIPAAAELRCRCGANGCLAAAASGGALAQRLYDAGLHTVHESRDVVRMVEQGNADAVAAVREAGTLVGEVLATAVSLLNPSVLIIGADMANTNDHFMTAMREVLYQRTQPLGPVRGLVTRGDRPQARHRVMMTGI